MKTQTHEVEVNIRAKAFEKPWFTSKKFIAFLIMEVVLGSLSVLALLTQRPLGWPLSAFMVAGTLTMGAIAFGFISGQAALDKFLRGIALNKLQPNIDRARDEGENGYEVNDDEENKNG